jgi:hypothetical protein
MHDAAAVGKFLLPRGGPPARFGSEKQTRYGGKGRFVPCCCHALPQFGNIGFNPEGNMVVAPAAAASTASRIELSQLPRGHDEGKLLRAMGLELANVHLGTRRAVAAGRRDLTRRKSKWLRQAAEVIVMAEATLKDWKKCQEWMR